MHYMYESDYIYLLQILQEYDSANSPTTNNAQTFASYFQQDGSYYGCANYDGYLQFLAGIFQDGEYGAFDTWSYIGNLKSANIPGVN